MLEKKKNSSNPLKVAVVADRRAVNLTKGRKTEEVRNKKHVSDAVPKWYTGRISPSHEGMIW